VLIVDDEVAFCGGSDFAPNRWDTPLHLDDDPHRILPSGRAYPPRHEVMMVVEGQAARALGDLARERWRRRTGEVDEAPPAESSGSAWPDQVHPVLTHVDVAIARTEPAWEGRAGFRENERLHLEAIATARDLILLENQYFTSPKIGHALAARLSERHGPEIVIVGSRHSPGFTDAAAMDSARDALVAELHRLDRFGRFSAYAPQTRRGKFVIVHSKVAIIDDRLLRIGSTNLNNRSLGYDTECDLAIAAAEHGTNDTRQAIRGFACDLVAHHLGRSGEEMLSAMDKSGRVARAIRTLDNPAYPRLQPLPCSGPSPVGAFIAERHLFDPSDRSDAWRPWKRQPGPARGHWWKAGAVAVGMVFLLLALL
jgi:phosphatidylserine/phosphatidylglycerophosphate/cardiolipin synthase-like enzyme